MYKSVTIAMALDYTISRAIVHLPLEATRHIIDKYWSLQGHCEHGNIIFTNSRVQKTKTNTNTKIYTWRNVKGVKLIQELYYMLHFRTKAVGFRPHFSRSYWRVIQLEFSGPFDGTTDMETFMQRLPCLISLKRGRISTFAKLASPIGGNQLENLLL